MQSVVNLYRSPTIRDVTIVVMSTDSIVALLISERDKLDRAIKALQETETSPSPTVSAPVAEGKSAVKKRHVSAAGRRRMALGQKKRWANLKAATK
jgi:hypothetical protein